MRVRDWVPSGRRAVLPGVAWDLREARRRGVNLPRLYAAQQANLDLLPSLASLTGGLVLDIGANVGDWSASALIVEPSVEIIAVEPAADSFAQLVTRFRSDPRVTPIRAAVSGTEGERDFYVAAHPHNSSLLTPRPTMNSEYGHGWDVQEISRVNSTTIDSLSDGRAVQLLKLDIQGGELEALAGAVETLRRTAAVLLEVTFVSHYDGDTTFAGLHHEMTSCGFRLANMSAPHLSVSGAALWSDACYVREPGLEAAAT